MQSPRLTSVTSATYVPKVCAYVTRDGGSELLVFHGPGHDDLQIPKGTIEDGEPLESALRREVHEESGLLVSGARRIASDVWTRRPRKKYVRHFYHVEVDEPRDEWTHVVTGEGQERGETFEYFWVPTTTERPFALSLDDYLPGVAQDAATSSRSRLYAAVGSD